MLQPMVSQRVRYDGATKLNMLKSANTVLGYLLLLELIFNLFVLLSNSGNQKVIKQKFATL